MKVSLKKAKDCKVQMSVEVDPKTVEARYLEVLKDFQRQARLPGFREGKAPADLIEKRFAEEAREEMLKSLIPEMYHQSVQAQKVSPVSLPKISGVQYTRGQKLVFSAEFEEAPDTHIKNYKSIKLKRQTSEVTDGDVEKGLKQLLDSRAEYLPLETERPVAQGDTVLADIDMWEENKYVPGRQDVLLSVEPSDQDDFFTKIIGAHAGETRQILKDGKPFSRVNLKEVRIKKSPELNDEFARAFGRDDLAALKEILRKEIAAQKHAESLEKMKTELFSKLVGMSAFSVPESLVEKQIERLVTDTHRHYSRMGMTPAQWEEAKKKVEEEAVGRARDQVKLYFILQRIAELEQVEADEIELEERLKGMAKQAQRPLDEARRVFEDDLRDGLREKKTIDFLIANAKFDES